MKWAVYQTRAENERREDGGAAHIGHHREELDIELDGKKLTQGDSFVYLGGAVCGDGKTEREVRRRVQAGANAWRAVEAVMADRRISKRLNGKVMSTCVTPACLYGAETMALTELQLPTRAGGREFNLRPGQYSRMSFSPDQVTGKVFSSEHAFPSKFLIYLEHCPRVEAVIADHLGLSSMRSFKQSWIYTVTLCRRVASDPWRQPWQLLSIPLYLWRIVSCC